MLVLVLVLVLAVFGFQFPLDLSAVALAEVDAARFHTSAQLRIILPDCPLRMRAKASSNSV